MKPTKFLILALFFILLPFNFSNAQNLSSRLKGKILLQVEDAGQAWYIEPETQERAYLGRPADAFRIMRELGLGIKHKELEKYLNSSFPKRLSGKILLDVEQNGEAYYVDPQDSKGYFLNRPKDAFSIMRGKGLGITNNDLWEIPLSEKYPDESKATDLQSYIDSKMKKVEKEVARINQPQEIKEGKNNQPVIESSDTILKNEKLTNLKNYLNKLEQELVLLENDYNQLADNINSENNTYKQEYDDNIRYTDNKYQEDINYYKPTHDYWVNYYQHQIDLEVGMGLRADKEEINYYQNKLNLENTNYNNLIARLQNNRDTKKSQYKSNYDSQLLNINQRLNTITETYNKAKAEREILKQDILEEIKSLSDSDKVISEISENKKETAVVKNWQLTQKFTGSQAKETEKFQITDGEKFKIKYSYTPYNRNEGHLFVVAFFAEGDSESKYYELIANDIIDIGETANNEKIIYNKPANLNYYFSAGGMGSVDAGDWTVEVYEYLPNS